MEHKHPPTGKFQVLAQKQADHIELEIHKLQHIDQKVQSDIRALRERLKIQNDQECFRCKVLLKEF